MSFLFYLKVKKIVLMIFSPILNVIDPFLLQKLHFFNYIHPFIFLIYNELGN